MRLTSVEIEGVGRFGTASRLTGLGAGVNILSAGNEAGKSTFFRAIRACLFERHTTRNDTIRNLSTSGLCTASHRHAGFRTPRELLQDLKVVPEIASGKSSPGWPRDRQGP